MTKSWPERSATSYLPAESATSEFHCKLATAKVDFVESAKFCVSLMRGRLIVATAEGTRRCGGVCGADILIADKCAGTGPNQETETMNWRSRGLGIVKSCILGTALVAGVTATAYADNKLTLSGSASFTTD